MIKHDNLFIFMEVFDTFKLHAGHSAPNGCIRYTVTDKRFSKGDDPI